jgi:hypothetical protein
MEERALYSKAPFPIQVTLFGIVIEVSEPESAFAFIRNAAPPIVCSSLPGAKVTDVIPGASLKPLIAIAVMALGIDTEPLQVSCPVIV